MSIRVFSPLVRFSLMAALVALHYFGYANAQRGMSIFRPRPPIRPPFDPECECNNFIWTRRNGVRAGNCLSDDFDGNPFCYLNQPNRCRDAIPSRRFGRMEVSKLGCGCRIGRDGFCLPRDPIRFIGRSGAASNDDNGNRGRNNNNNNQRVPLGFHDDEVATEEDDPEEVETVETTEMSQEQQQGHEQGENYDDNNSEVAAEDDVETY